MTRTLAQQPVLLLGVVQLGHPPIEILQSLEARQAGQFGFRVDPKGFPIGNQPGATEQVGHRREKRCPRSVQNELEDIRSLQCGNGRLRLLIVDLPGHDRSQSSPIRIHPSLEGPLGGIDPQARIAESTEAGVEQTEVVTVGRKNSERASRPHVPPRGFPAPRIGQVARHIQGEARAR